MPLLNSQTSFNPAGGLNATAGLQMQALGGGDPNADFMGLLERLLPPQKKGTRIKAPVQPKDAATEALNANAIKRRAQMENTQAYQNKFGRDRVNLSTTIGGPPAQHFQDYAARQGALTAGGVPIYDYTGMKDIVAGNAGASEAAAKAAGEAGLQRNAQNERARNMMQLILGRSQAFPATIQDQKKAMNEENG